MFEAILGLFLNEINCEPATSSARDFADVGANCWWFLSMIHREVSQDKENADIFGDQLRSLNRYKCIWMHMG